LFLSAFQGDYPVVNEKSYQYKHMLAKADQAVNLRKLCFYALSWSSRMQLLRHPEMLKETLYCIIEAAD
jgi:hypothetical protein